jgi:hypothetical protein
MSRSSEQTPSPHVKLSEHSHGMLSRAVYRCQCLVHRTWSEPHVCGTFLCSSPAVKPYSMHAIVEQNLITGVHSL